MIVEKSKQQQQHQQQQRQQRLLHQPTLSDLRNQEETPMQAGRELQFGQQSQHHDEEEEEEGDNDEENIVIDLPDEDEDDETSDLDQQLDSLIQLNRNHQNGHFVSSAYATTKGQQLNTKLQANNFTLENNNNNNQTSTNHDDQALTFKVGDLVWFDPNQFGYFIPGKVIDFYDADLSVLTVEGYAQPAPLALSAGDNLLSINNNNNPNYAAHVTTYEQYNRLLLDSDQELQLYELSDIEQLRSVKLRLPLSELSGTSDLIDLHELSRESILWNLKLRYIQELVYTNCGQKILLSINPFKQLSDLYNLEQVNKYDKLTNSIKLRSLSSCCPNGIVTSNDASLDDGAHQCASGLIRWLLLHDNNNNNKITSTTTTTTNDGTKFKQQQQQQKLAIDQDKSQNEPHIFRLANESLKKLLITGQDQCFVLLGESGAGKTEACKLLVQYFATVNKSPTNLMTEQILESIQVLESFGNAKTVHNDNSSRFGKLLEIRFNLNNGFILDAKTIDLNLLDRSRIVGQADGERNYHVFYELLSGLSVKEKEKYGLQTADKYFYLNQGHCLELQSKEDGDDFRSLLGSMQVLGFNYEEQDTIFRILASVLHLGNIYFHRKVLAVRSGKLAAANTQQHHSHKQDHTQSSSAGVEGVEIGSDTEVRWVSHLLQIQFDSVMRCLSTRTTEASTTVQAGDQTQVLVDRIVTPLNIDQALDTRDAIARTLYNCLFKWLVQRINVMINQEATNNSGVKQAESSEDKMNRQEPVYLCRTSESLCEFQPDKLNSRNSTLSRQKSNQAHKQHKKHQLQHLSSATISILDAFGFENLSENNFEQLCVNYAAELLHYHTSRYMLRLEQAEYARERLKWTNIVSCFAPLGVSSGIGHQLAAQSSLNQSSTLSSNTSSGVGLKSSNADAIVNLISKKPRGILALLDHECNFPKASDQSFVEKCHHNHALDENYQRSRLDANCQEFGVRHFKQSSRLVWYQVEGFIEKNLDTLRPDIVELLVGSKMVIVADMLRKLHQAQDFSSSAFNKTLTRTYDGRFVSMKPRATTVAARFQDALHNNRVLESINSSHASCMQLANVNTDSSHYYQASNRTQAEHSDHQQLLNPNPWFVFCLKPNRSKSARVFDVAYVQDQLATMNLVEIAQIRKRGFPIRLRYGEFLRTYKCLMPKKFLKSRQTHADRSGGDYANGAIPNSIREECSSIVEFNFRHKREQLELVREQFQCGLTKIFLNEKLYEKLEHSRLIEHQKAIVVLQKTFRMLPVRREFLDLRAAATVIQTQWRGFLSRREFWRQYMLIVYLQQRWRQQLALRRRKHIESRRREQRQRQQQLLQEVQAQQMSLSNQLRFRLDPQQQQRHLVGAPGSNYQAIARLNLDIPEDLAQLYRLQRNWIPVHDLSNVNEIKLEELTDRERRRRSRHRNKVDSVPFIVLDEDNERTNSVGCCRKGMRIVTGLAKRATPLKSRQLLVNLIQEFELDERYSLQNMLARYFPIDVPQFGYSRLPITRPFSWHQMARARHLALKQGVQSLRQHLKAAASGGEFDAGSSGGQLVEQRKLEINRRFNIVELKALAIYKLILRYIDSTDSDRCQLQQQQQHHQINLTNLQKQQQLEEMQKLVKFKLIADYLIYLCLTDANLRDELYLQLISQSWQNPKVKSSENVWKLMANCLSCFAPSDLKLRKFLLKYTSDYCCDKYRPLVLNRVAQSLLSELSESEKMFPAPPKARKFPPSMLEYWANQRSINRLALAATCYMDDHSLNGPIFNQPPDDDEDLSITNYGNKTLIQIEPRTTAEELAAAALRARNVSEFNLAGWSVEVQHEGAQSGQSCRLRGDDQLMDHFARLELLPEFQQLIEATGECESESWLSEEERLQQTLSRHPAPTSHYQAPSPGQYPNHLRAPQSQQQQQQQHHYMPAGGRQVLRRKLSLSELSTAPPTTTTNHRLSVQSSEYVPSGSQSHRHSYVSTGSMQPELERSVSSRLSQTSKLNRRYLRELADHAHQYPHYQEAHMAHKHHPQANMTNSSRLNRRSLSMQELQLASASALNERYFNHSGAVAGNHYASSYVQPMSQFKHQSSSSGLASRASSSNQAATPTNHQMRRRSQTPNSMLRSSNSSTGAHRMSSSAYGSESHRSFGTTAPGSVAHSDQLQSFDSKYPSQRLSRLEMVENGRGDRVARRSASTSSRAPASLMGAAHSDYASAAYSDYERIAGPQSRGYATPNSAAVNYSTPQQQQQQQQMMMMKRLTRQPSDDQRAYPSRMAPGINQRRRVVAGSSGSNQKQGSSGQQKCAPEVEYQQPMRTQMGKQQQPASGVYASASASNYIASSAMSDTSEAPSLASHVRAVKVPQHNGDLDQYLDDLFNPMLDDAELDELSDARSLATSIRGTSSHALCDPKKLSELIRGTQRESSAEDEEEGEEKTHHDEVESSTHLAEFQQEVVEDSEVDGAHARAFSPTFESLFKSLKGNTLSSVGRSLVGSTAEDLGSQNLATSSSSSAAPLMSQLAKLNLSELKALNEKLEQEIEAAQHNRTVQSSDAMLGGPQVSRGEPSGSLSASISAVPAPPPLPNFGAPPMEDVYDRAKTIRIGKWRWPPARDEANSGSLIPNDESGGGGGGGSSSSNEVEQAKQVLLESAQVEQQIISYFENRDKKRLSQMSSASSGLLALDTPLKQQQERVEIELAEQNLVQAGNVQVGAASPSLNVGKLKISSEMKAKLEQLTITSSPASANSRESGTSDTPSSAGLVKQIKNLLVAAGGQQQADGSGSSVKRLADQRKNLLEIQLAGSKDSSTPVNLTLDNLVSSNRTSIESTGSKILAAKQQLAAAAGVALIAFDSNAQHASADQQASALGKSEERNSRALQDELGPQSRTAISQRQAFYQMSASSDQLDNISRQLDTSASDIEHANSERQLNQVEIPAPNAISSDNLIIGSSVAPTGNNNSSNSNRNSQLTRSIQMAANLNEIGQSNCPSAIESERLYGQSIAKSLSQRQQESLKRVSCERKSRAPTTTSAGDRAEQHQWVSSSPDRQLENSLKRRAKRSSDQEKSSKTRRLSNQQQQQRRRHLAADNEVEQKLAPSRSNKRTARDQSKGHKIDQQQSTSKQQQGKQQLVELADDELCVAHANVDWQIKIRKEFFLPSETYDDPLVVQLIFAQLVADVFNPRHWTRLNNKERAAMKSLMKDNSIGYSPSLPQIGQLQEVKRDLVRMARSFGLYFTRSYPATNFALIYSDPNHNFGLNATILDSEYCSLWNRQRKSGQEPSSRTRRRRSSSLAANSNESQSSSSSSSSESQQFDENNQDDDSNHQSEAIKLMLRLRNANNLGSDWIDLVAVHHSGLRLVALVAGDQQQQALGSNLHASTNGNELAPPTPLPPFGYRVLETLKFRDMTNVSQVGASELLVSMRNGKKCWLISSNQAAQLATLLRCFHADYNDHLSTGSSITKQAKTEADREKEKEAGQEQSATRAGTRHKHQKQREEERERKSKNVLLVADDDHHDDHFKQRQTSNGLGERNKKTHPNYDLADNKRILSNNLAISSKKINQQSECAISQSVPASASSSSSPPPPSSSAAAGASAASKQEHSNKQQLPLSPNTIDDASTELAQPPGGALDEQQPQKNSKKKLWQNSLSRMSTKFSIFGSQSNRTNNQKFSNHEQQQQQETTSDKKLINSQPQVALDAWIETKVDFDEDEESSECRLNSTALHQQVAASAISPQSSTKSQHSGCASELSQRSGGDQLLTSADSKELTLKKSQSSGLSNTTNSADADGKYSLLQFALYNFRDAIDKYSLESRANKNALNANSVGDTSTLRGSLKLIESLRSNRRQSTTSGDNNETIKTSSGKGDRKSGNLLLHGSNNQTGGDWTWRELAEMVKFTRVPIRQSLLKLSSEELSKRAVECFAAIMQYMGDLPAALEQSNSFTGGGSSKQQVAGSNSVALQLLQADEVECVYLILMNCHNYAQLRDEIYCQLMKQTTNNRSEQPSSCLRGWRLFSIVAAYFDCSEAFKPYLLKYLESAAYDKQRAYYSVAALCLQNLRKTFKYNGRKNVPSIEEIAATSAGRNSKRQIYRLPGGTERVINTKSTTVVDDIIHEICSNMLNVTDPDEMLEFSLYCIADGDLYTMPLNRDEYILDITTELIKNHQQYFLIFCRSIWHYPLRLDSKLYIEVIFNQIAPDYIEGLLLVLPSLRIKSSRNRTAQQTGEPQDHHQLHHHPSIGSSHKHQQPLRLKSKLVREIARIAALLHRASGTDYMPHKDEIKYLLPKPIITAMRQHQRALNALGSSGSVAPELNNPEGGPLASMRGVAADSAGSSSSAASTTSNGPSENRAHNSVGSALDTDITTPQKWIELVQNNWRDMSAFDTLDAKAQFLDIVRHWPLFGSSFFAIKLIQRDLIQPMDFILALNKLGIQMLDLLSHETIHRYPFNEVISTRKVRSEDGALFLDLKCGNLMRRTIIRIQTDQAHEISRLIRQYIDIELLQQKQHQHQQSSTLNGAIPAIDNETATANRARSASEASS